ncbi:unnamed protein product, partial [Prorocentrum cordatum]
ATAVPTGCGHMFSYWDSVGPVSCDIGCWREVDENSRCGESDNCCLWFMDRVAEISNARDGKEAKEVVASDSNDPDAVKDMICEQGGEEKCALGDWNHETQKTRLYSVMDGLPLAGQRSLASVATIGLGAIGGAAALAGAALAFRRCGAPSAPVDISANEAAGGGQRAPIMASQS